MLEAKGMDAVLLYGGLGMKEKRIQFEKAKHASVILSTSSYIGEGIDIGHLDTIYLRCLSPILKGSYSI